MKVKVLSYNIHGCVNSRRQIDVKTISKIIGSIKADIIALQEVDTEKPISKNINQAKTISAYLGMDYLYFPVEKTGRHAFGLAIFFRYPVVNTNIFLLPNLYRRLKMRKRGVIRITLHTLKGNIHIINTHLSVYKLERYFQLISVLGWNNLSNLSLEEPVIFCGDLNANPTSLIYRKLSRYLIDIQRKAYHTVKPKPTFPSKFPIFRIDHILVSNHFRIINAEVVKNELTLKASDHLPVVADLRL
ncbi:MAG: endonuclease/exonuclease/phosphatase family protein [Desulfosarcina sp.]|jgi:endonuclease/exonuclease/phosphatase family metal-dependent hydrolase